MNQKLSSPITPYHKLYQLAKERHGWSALLDLLNWDQETYMPKDGANFRSFQTSLVAVKLHECETSVEVQQELSKVIDLETGKILDATLSSVEQAAVRVWRKDYLSQTKLPPSFIQEFASVTSQAVSQWELARKNNHFEQFAPWLEKIVSLCQQKCAYLAYHDHPYDALLELYEPGATVKSLSPLFTALKDQLRVLLTKIVSCPQVKIDFLQTPCDFHPQLMLGEKLLTAVGLTPVSSRLDISQHPSCTGFAPSDIRITTRIEPCNFISNIYSILHEAGHGLYAKGLSSRHYGTPLGQQASVAIDESQSRLFETRVGRSYEFCSYLLPQIHEAFPALSSTHLLTFYQGVNHVSPSCIRVEADEVTYCLHVILRFEIERDLMAGKILVKDLPKIWNAKMHELLGITPPDDANGILQDIHWSLGYFGYFPTYALGNLYASQLFETFLQQNLQWKEQLRQGDFSSLHQWLNTHIYQEGRLLSPHELIVKITGKPLDERAFIHYLNQKYQAIYRFES